MDSFCSCSTYPSCLSKTLGGEVSWKGYPCHLGHSGRYHTVQTRKTADGSACCQSARPSALKFLCDSFWLLFDLFFQRSPSNSLRSHPNPRQNLQKRKRKRFILKLIISLRAWGATHPLVWKITRNFFPSEESVPVLWLSLQTTRKLCTSFWPNLLQFAYDLVKCAHLRLYFLRSSSPLLHVVGGSEQSIPITTLGKSILGLEAEELSNGSIFTTQNMVRLALQSSWNLLRSQPLLRSADRSISSVVRRTICRAFLFKKNLPEPLCRTNIWKHLEPSTKSLAALCQQSKRHTDGSQADRIVRVQQHPSGTHFQTPYGPW